MKLTVGSKWQLIINDSGIVRITSLSIDSKYIKYEYIYPSKSQSFNIDVVSFLCHFKLINDLPIN